MNWLRQRASPERRVDLRVRVGAVELANPIMTASGTAGHGAELAAYADLGRLGAAVVKSVSAEPWPGNPAPRLYPVPAGMLNSVGLQNRGAAAWLADELPELVATGARVVASIWGFTADGYEAAAETVAGAPVVAVEINVSCPNVEDRRRMFAHSTEGVAAAVGAAKRGLGGSGLPLWAKLSPNVTDLPEIAGAAVSAGADALTLVNTLMGLALDPATGRPRVGGGGGGLSGAAIHPVAVRAVYDCRAAHPGVPIVGVGGVDGGEGAAELLVAGANAVQVGTATFADPRAPLRVLEELEAWCLRHDVAAIADLVGRAHH